VATMHKEGHPPKWEGPSSTPEARTDTNNQDTTCTEHVSNSSRQVSWWSVREFVQPYLDAVGSWPMAGTPAWCALDGTDPAKWAALLDGGQHWALRVETCQQACCEASRDISAADDWSRVATKMVQRESFYAARPYLKRVAS
jgi:Protein of unknown function (DUF2742)